MFFIGIICSVSHDYMVEEMHSHNGACFPDCNCQRIIFPAWCKASAGVVVTDCEDGGIVQQDFTHDNSDVGISLSDAAYADALCFQKFVVLIH